MSNIDFDPKKLKRLQSSIKASRRKMEPFRKCRRMFIEEYVGKWYGDHVESKTFDKRPLNMIKLGVNTYGRLLAARIPKALVETEHPQLKPFAYDIKLALDFLAQKISIKATMDKLVQEALMSYLAVVKIGMGEGQTVSIGGQTHETGLPFAECVSLDDYVCDMTATAWNDVEYEGNRYRIPFEALQDSALYDKAAVKDLKPTQRPKDDDLDASAISGQDGDEDEYVEHIELWDVWLPMENTILTFVADEGSEETGKVIRQIEFDGPQAGPYRKFGFNDVPSNLMYSAPVSEWYDTHTATNAIFRKCIRQAERQKTNTLYRDAGEAEAQKDASDGDMIRSIDPGATQEIRRGGVDQLNFSFLGFLKMISSYAAGNLDSLAGLGTSADTLGQEQLIAAGGNKQLAEMSDRTVNMAAGIFQDLAYYLFTDPFIDLPLVKPVDEKLGLYANTRFQGSAMAMLRGRDPRQMGDFVAYNINIQPYSMAHATPQSRMQDLNEVLQGIIMPLAPVLQSQGLTPNMEGILKLIAKYKNMPDLSDIVVRGGQPLRPSRGMVQVPQNPQPKVDKAPGKGSGKGPFDFDMGKLVSGGMESSQKGRA